MHFATYPNLAAIAATRPLKRKKAAGFLLPPSVSRTHRSGKPKASAVRPSVDAEFIVVPDKNIGDVKYVVHSWTVNGEQKASGDSKNFVVKGLLYSKRYVITAVVTINGKEQKVLPFQWNSIDAPVWMITRVGNSDKEYQVLCTN